MNLDDKLRECIESYLNGELSHDEEKEVENKLETDSEFKSEFENIKATRQLLDLYNRIELKKMLESYAAEQADQTAKQLLEESTKVKPFRIKFHWYHAVASLLILFMISYSYVDVAKNYSNEGIFVSQFEPRAAATVTVRKEGSNPIASTLNEGLSEYDAKNYTQAISILNTITEENEENFFEAQFYLGNSYLAVRKSTLAIEAFIRAEGYRNEDARKWYLGLAYLANNEIDPARKLFQTLIDIDSHKYKRTSISVLEKLDSKLRVLPGVV